MNARSFSLILYKNGDRIDTSNKKKIALTDFYGNGFVTNPSGLGIKNIIGNLRIGNRNLPAKIENDSVPIIFEIAFLDYVKYNNFIKNIAWSNYQAVLEYVIPDVGTFYRDVTFEEITKSEIVDGYLSSSVSITPESFWYKEVTTQITMTANVYSSYLFSNDSDLPCEIYFHTYKKCNELLIEVNTSIDTIGCKLQNLQELEYPIIRYSSEDGNSYIYNQGSSANWIKDILNSRYVNLDSKYVPFLKIPRKENAYVRFKCDVDNTVSLTIKSFFVSV